MSEDIHKWTTGRYTLMFDEHTFFVWDNVEEKRMTALNVTKKLNEQDKEIGLLQLELDTHKHPLWSTREAERKVNELADNLADEVKKNGLLNEDINQLRIENMRLKKTEKINMEYAEQIVKENQKLRIAKNDLRIENDRLRQKIEKASDMLDEIDFFLQMQ